MITLEEKITVECARDLGLIPSFSPYVWGKVGIFKTSRLMTDDEYRREYKKYCKQCNVDKDGLVEISVA